MNNVLVIVNSKAAADDWRRLVNKELFPSCNFIYSFLVEPHVDYYSLYNHCCHLVETENINSVVSGHHGYQLIHGALCRKFTHLTGPSLDSLCAVLHRFYVRQTTGLSFPNEARLVQVDGNIHTLLASNLEDIQGPFVIKDAIRRHNSICKIFKNKRQVWKDIADIKSSVNVTELSVVTFLKQVANVDRFTRILDTSLFIEALYDSKFDLISRHNVEFCVYGEDFIPWAITDKNYWKKHPFCLKSVTLPTTLSEHTKHEIWAIMRETVYHLSPMGFSNYFLRAEVGIMGDGQPRVLDLSCGTSLELLPLYRLVLINGDSLKAQLDMGLDQVVRRPKFLHNKHGCLAYISTFWEGELEEAIDIKQAKSLEGVHVLYRDQQLAPPREFGCNLAAVYVATESREDCEQEIHRVIPEFIKLTDKCPWMEEIDN